MIKLYPQTRDPSQFKGFIETVLATAVPDNKKLEILGQEKVTYEIDPKFLEGRGLSRAPSKTLTVVDDGRLAVSSGHILTEKEQQELEIAQQMSGAKGPVYSPNFNVRPGNPIYLMVRDRDRSVSSSPDTLSVRIKTRSGDVLPAVELTETEAHSGIFRGSVETELPPPRAYASDSAEGINPGDIINHQRSGQWESRSDGKEGKWIEVDTMASHVVKQAKLVSDDAKKVSDVTLMGVLAGDLIELGHYPERTDVKRGGVDTRYVEGGDFTSINAFRDGFEKAEVEPVNRPDFGLSVPGDGGLRPVQVKGAFYLPEAQSLTFHFIPVEDSQTAMKDCFLYFLVDGELHVAGQGDRLRQQGITVSLSEGGHWIEVFGLVQGPSDDFILGLKQADGSIQPIPTDWFDPSKHEALAEFLKDKARISVTDEGFVADFPEPQRLRKLRWVFNEYKGDSLSASEFVVVDENDNKVLPSAKDFTDALGDDVVQTAPGDRIIVEYVDDVNTKNQKRTLSSQLSSTFNNGSLGFNFEVLEQTANATVSKLYNAYRFQPGDNFMIVVRDPDLDVSPQADTVEVKVRTRAGAELVLTAVEIGAPGAVTKGEDGTEKAVGIHSGQFKALLRTSLTEETGGETIKVQKGDKLTASYMDRENTNPSIPFEREVELLAVQPSTPAVTLYHTWREREVDSSKEALERMELIRKRSGNDEVTQIYKFTSYAMAMSDDEVAPEELAVNGDTHVPFEIYYSSKALHSGSVLRVRAMADSEVALAEVEGREPKGVDTAVRLGSGASGLVVQPNPKIAEDSLGEVMSSTPESFAGAIWFKLGVGGDELLNQAQSMGDVDLLAGPKAKAEKAGPVANTLNVQGNDMITLELLDDENNVLFTRRLRLVSEGSISLKDATFEAERNKIHLGEKFYVQVVDRDQDVSPESDTVTVSVAGKKAGSSVDLVLRETLAHSGVFTGVIRPEFAKSAAADVVEETTAEGEEAIEEEVPMQTVGIPTVGVVFGDQLVFTYNEAEALPVKPAAPRETTGLIFDGSDGRVTAFTKRFADADMAVKVQFRLAECLFEMAKDFRKLKANDKASVAIADGKIILEEALRNYPDTSLVVEGEYLLANLYMELGEEQQKAWEAAAKEQGVPKDERTNRYPLQQESADLYQEALSRFSALLSTYPDSEFAPRSQYKKALALEKLGDFSRSSEEYVKMTYIFPESPLVGDAAVRLAKYYYETEKRYDVAGRIYANFYKRFENHKLAPKALFLAAQCRMVQAETWEKEAREQGVDETKLKTPRVIEEYMAAVENLDTLIHELKDSIKPELRAQAMYWAGDAALRGLDYQKAFIYLKQTTFEYPDSQWARRARGLLLKSGEEFEGM